MEGVGEGWEVALVVRVTGIRWCKSQSADAVRYRLMWNGGES